MWHRTSFYRLHDWDTENIKWFSAYFAHWPLVELPQKLKSLFPRELRVSASLLFTSVWVSVFVYPVSGADGLVSGPWAGAEVELLDRETFVIETDVVRSAGRPILNVSQVSVSIDQHVSTTET